MNGNAYLRRDSGIDRLQSALESVESDQRGYLLNGEEKYLDRTGPRWTGRDQPASLKQLTQDNARQQQRLARIESVKSEMAPLWRKSSARRAQGLPAAGDVAAMTKARVSWTNPHASRRCQTPRSISCESGRSQQRRDRQTLSPSGRQRSELPPSGHGLSFLKQGISGARKPSRRAPSSRPLEGDGGGAHGGTRPSNEQLKKEIAGHQQAKEALRLQREWLHVTLTSIGDGVLATDTAGQITFLNPVPNRHRLAGE